MQLIINNGTFPNPLASQADKSKKEFGSQVAKAILAATAEYREKRNEIFSSNRAYAEGKQSMKPLLDMMEVDGKSVYTNISIKAGMYAKKFEKIVVDGYMERKQEYPKVTALSRHIQERKDKRRSDAQMRMELGSTLDIISQEAGVPLTDPSEFTPESQEQLDLYFDINDKEKEELLMQETLTYVFNDIGLEALKRRILTDQFQVNLFGLYEYLDNNGRECVDYIQGEDCIYSNSFQDDFGDVTYSGRIIRMPLSKLRARFAISDNDEKIVYDSLKKFTGRFGNSTLPKWNEDYRFRDVRPYDNFTVEVVHIWWQCNKVMETTEGTDRYGRSVFDTSYKLTPTGKSSDGRKETKRVYPLTAYEGYFINDACYCLQWGEQTNQLRDGNYKEELINPFIFHMVDNHGGMLSPSAIESIKDDIQMMDLQKLKIKQIIAKTPPDGLAIDISSLMNIDLGEGETQPLDLLTIYRQTGDIYYSSMNEDGTKIYQTPVRPNQSSIGDKINAAITIYNLSLNNIRDTLGINEFRDGSATNARTGFRFAQAQSEASNTATISNYMAYVSAVTKLTRQMGIRIWDALKYGNPNKGYLRNLGEKNVKLIQAKGEIIQSIYDFKYELGISAEEKAYLEQNINTCLAAGTLEMPDVLRIRRTMDSGFALAERMLSYLYSERRRINLEEKDMISKNQASYSAEAGKSVEQAKQQTVQLQIQSEQAKEEARSTGDQILTLMKGAMDLITESFKSGKEIPQQFLPIVELAIGNASLKTQQTASQTQQQMEQEAQAQEQQQIVQQVQQGLSEGSLSEEQAQQILAENGIQ